MILQQVSKALKRIQLNIRLDCTVTLADWRLNFSVDQLYDIFDMRREISLVCAH
jgi:hypothetical protein